MIKARTSSGDWEPFVDSIARIIRENPIDMRIEDRPVRGFRSSINRSIDIRGHSDILRAGVYVEEDVKSAVDCFLMNQSTSGRIFNTIMTAPRNQFTERENWEKWRRSNLAVDAEFRLIKAAYLGWQATGDGTWITENLSSLQKALQYTLTSPLHWDDKNGLIKRPYSIDSWEVSHEIKGKPGHDQADDTRIWGIFHGDNSGYYQSANLLASLFQESNLDKEAAYWLEIAEGIKDRSNKILFNGRFYTHFHKLTPYVLESVKESEQMSIGNPMAINRGFSSQNQAARIIKEYMDRHDSERAFACWFGIDPPFPHGTFGDLSPGTCINGGILPLAGAELANAAFHHGFEEFGCKQLELYRELLLKEGYSFLWYHPDGTPGEPMTGMCAGTGQSDAWGASAMLHAFLDGFCGIKDLGHSFQQVSCSPRWAVTEEEDVEIEVTYEATSASFGYRFRHLRSENKIVCHLLGGPNRVKLHVLLPPGTRPSTVSFGEIESPFKEISVEDSIYVDFEAKSPKDCDFTIKYDRIE